MKDCSQNFKEMGRQFPTQKINTKEFSEIIYINDGMYVVNEPQLKLMNTVN